MAEVALSKPVTDSVTKIDNEVAVGEDLEFQEKWWRFEHAIWILFVILILLDVAGFFGRGPVAHAQQGTGDGAMDIKYERIERTGTPAMMTILFGPKAIQDGKIQLFISESLVDELGAQRIVPAPDTTVIGNGGLTYTFPASIAPAYVKFALQPSSPGAFKFKVQVANSPAVNSRIIVVP